MLTPSPETEANRIARLPTAEARAELNRLLALAIGGPFGVEPNMLDFNARLVTELRARGVRIWD